MLIDKGAVMQANVFLKDRPLIYGIRNVVNGKIYVGKTRCVYDRCNQYLYDFREKRKDRINDYLMNSLLKYGIENFEIFPLEFCGLDTIAERELHWIVELKALDRIYGYNLRLDSSTGMIASKETGEKIRRNLKQQWIDGKRRMHSEKLKANWAAAPEERRIKQGEFFVECLTKWEYVIEYEGDKTKVCKFKELKELGFGTALSYFKRKKSDSIILKGYQITRRKIV